MKVVVIIPTCSSERFSLLVNEVRSIQGGTYKDVYIIIVVDGNLPLYVQELRRLHDIDVLQNEERIGWIASINRVLRIIDSDYYIYASDDLIFPPNCIESAMRTMQERFPDGYGLVTISKKNRCPFGLIGNKFVEHFPNRQVFCPDYKHYSSDTELKRFVIGAKLFAYPTERDSQVFHYRVGGETRRFARQVRERDWSVRDERKELGYLWGADFNLVSTND